MKAVAGLWAAVAACLLVSQAGAAAAKDFYEGKQVEFVISEGVGGGFDTIGRLIAAYMGQHLPGHPTLVVRNMPGAGGIVGANYLYNIAPHDGTSIGLVEESVYEAQLLQTAELHLDVKKFNWLGRIMSNNAVLVSRGDAPVQKIQDAYQKELVVSATGLSSQMRWSALQHLTGLKLKLIVGNQSSAEAFLAMQRGEVDAVSTPWSVFRAEHANWVADKKVNILLQTGTEKAADLPNVPRLIDMAKDDRQRQILQMFSQPESVGRSLAAPPGTPPELVAELRRAFEGTFADPKFQASLKQSKLTLDPLAGPALAEIIDNSLAVSPQLVAQAKKLAQLQ
jgi:tripartite-type tricarboxylate transporter receptor subunit TctC